MASVWQSRVKLATLGSCGRDGFARKEKEEKGTIQDMSPNFKGFVWYDKKEPGT